METYLHSAIAITFLKILLIILITLLLNSLVRSYVQVPHILDTRRRRTYLAVIKSTVSIVLFSIALHVIFIMIGINITPLLASAGIVGITIGIGARTLVEDLIAGIFLLTQATIAIGDYVLIGSAEGVIEDIGFRTLTLRSVTGALIVIPNGQVKQVVNYSWGNAVLFIDIPVKTGQKVESIIETLTGILTEMKKNNKKREYPITENSRVLGIENIQVGNCILIRVMIITSSSGRNIVDREYRYNVVKKFEKNKILFA